MLICSRCSTKNLDCAKFCKECGSNDLYDPDAEAKQKAREEELRQKEEKRLQNIKILKRSFIFMVCCLIFAGVCILLIFSMQNSKCNNGDISSCIKIAKGFNSINSEKKYKFYEKACEFDDLEACQILIYDKKFDRDENYYLNKICELGNDYKICFEQAEKLTLSSDFLDNAKADEYYEKACNGGFYLSCDIKKCKDNNADSCFNLGYNYYSGNKIERDYKKSREYYEKACNLNHLQSCKTMADFYEKGYIVGKNLDLSNDFNKKACELNDVISCKKVGLYYYKDTSTDSTKQLALSYFDKACELDEIDSCRILSDKGYTNSSEGIYKYKDYYLDKLCILGNDANLCFKRAKEEYLGYFADSDNALKLYEKACTLKHKESCIILSCEKFKDGHNCAYLGVNYFSGTNGFPKDIIKARELIAKACDYGESNACQILDLLCKNQDEEACNFKKCIVDKNVQACNISASSFTTQYNGRLDLSVANYFFEKACNLNNAEACFNIGEKYIIDKKIDKANFFLTKSCDLGGYFDACTILGVNYFLGKGFTKDINKANELFNKGCFINGSGSGCSNLGLNYEKGLGLTRNMKKAIELYKKSCKSGDEIGCFNLAYNYAKGNNIQKNIKKAYDILNDVMCYAYEPLSKINLEIFSNMVGAICNNVTYKNVDIDEDGNKKANELIKIFKDAGYKNPYRK